MKDKRRFRQAETQKKGLARGTEGCGKDHGLFGDCKEILVTEDGVFSDWRGGKDLGNE